MREYVVAALGAVLFGAAAAQEHILRAPGDTDELSNEVSIE